MEKNFISRVTDTPEKIIYEIHRIVNLKELLFSRGVGRVNVFSPLGHDVSSFTDILVEEIDALNRRVYKSERCKKRIAQLSYVLMASGESRMAYIHDLSTETARVFHVGMCQTWNRAAILRSQMLG